MGKCDVCGKETQTFVACSSCGAISFAYCAECLSAGREPYDALVGMGMTSYCINETYKQKVLLPSLRFYGKTLEEFDVDVDKADADYFDWLQHQDECVEYETDSFDF